MKKKSQENLPKSNEENIENPMDFFNIVGTGNLLNELNKLEIKTTAVEDIEIKEVVIKETGNFLNLKENIINIPLEMLIFPFFTPQKQNKRVNFQYRFEDLGVTMMSTLVSKGPSDKIFQPSIFEEKIYTYLLSLYEAKDEDDDNEYIDFEINEFIVSFLGNKMNRTYYTKVEQALKNLKNTEYQFVVSNHTLFGRYKFEDEEFKLLTYQKLKVGKKIYYRITLNKNIRKKIKEKRYIIYNSKALVEIMNLDPIAARIYKFISKARMEKDRDEINMRTLAAIIPLQTEQVTERSNKNGVMKTYVLCRLKQVLTRIQKAFDILVQLGYILNYSEVYDSEQNTYHLHYIFNKAKDGACHISERTLANKKEYLKLPSGIAKPVQHIQEAEIVHRPVAPKTTKAKVSKLPKKPETIEIVRPFSEIVLEKITKAKKNIYVSRSWEKRVDNKILKIVSEKGDEFAIELLNQLYKSLTAPIKTTLVQYISGISKNMEKEKQEKESQNLKLFSDFSAGNNKVIVTKTGVKRAAKTFKKPTISTLTEIIEETATAMSTDFDEKPGSSSQEISENKVNIIKNYDQLDEYEKLEVEKLARKLCCQEEGISESFLNTMRDKSKKIYINTIKSYIERVLEERI
ncbi:MAG: replication initiator protein A [Fusobacteriaceae bacterium]